MAVSDDGTVVAGDTAMLSGAVKHGQRWVKANGVWSATDLGSLNGMDVTPTAISRDGAVIAGSTKTGDFTQTAFRWTVSGGIVDLGVLPGHVSSTATAISGDGLTVVGSSRKELSETQQAFRWTSSGGMQALQAPGGAESIATAVNNHGSVIVGGYGEGVFQHNDAFRWTAATGVQKLQDLLSAAGVNVSGLRLADATGISGDGKIIVGLVEVVGQGNSVFIARYHNFTAGVTSPASVVESLSRSQSDSAAMMPEQGGAEAGVFGAWGSSAGGVYGQGGTKNVSVFGGLARASGESGAASFTQTDMGALGLRYRSQSFTPFRPFGEIGGWFGQDDHVRIARSYANGAGVATGEGQTSADAQYLFARLGARLVESDSDQLILALEYGRQALKLDGYAETASAGNPFPASVAGGSRNADIGAVQVQWSHAFARVGETTLSLEGVSELDGEIRGLNAAVVGLGAVPAQPFDKSTYGVYSAAFSRGLNDHLRAGAFVRGTFGADRAAGGPHFGVSLAAQF